MLQETRTCQNCKQRFTIEPEDFSFYEKIKVPAPTWCPECRLQRQLLWRNERALYKRRCDVPNHDEEVISMYAPDNPHKAYDQKYWWSDAWDPRDFGQEYDFSKPFFEQMNMLLRRVPLSALVVTNSVSSDYCNSVLYMKNCYLVFAAGWSENTCYANSIDYIKDSMELKSSINDELSYELLFCYECYRVFFSAFSDQCTHSAFLWDCRGCSYCFGCIGLRNKSYHIWNRPYTKEEYLEKVKEYDLGSFKGLRKLQEEFNQFRLKFPHRYARIIHSVNATGDNLKNAKNVGSCFDGLGEGLEDSKFIANSFTKPVRDSQSVFTIGDASSYSYDSISLVNVNSVFFSKKIWNGDDIRYSFNCHGSHNLFGCVGLRNKQYCILNKQYAKDEYTKLVARIVKHMDEVPYVDKKGRIYKYGEFFPPELSPFAYNETITQEYFPLSEAEAKSKGYRWRDPEERNYTITKTATDLPDHIRDVDDSIVKDVIQCSHAVPPRESASDPRASAAQCNEQCTTAFKIIPAELQFYRGMNLPLPRLCPNCRHYQRLKQRNPLKLWHRKCQCVGAQSTNGVYKNTIAHQHGTRPCPNEFETSYAPERKEVVYCEACYQSEVV